MVLCDAETKISALVELAVGKSVVVTVLIPVSPVTDSKVADVASKKESKVAMGEFSKEMVSAVLAYLYVSELVE